jgi:hypothetical protein
MEKSEQCLMIKFLWMKGLGVRRIHTKLSRVLGDDCYNTAAIERWHARFREGDLSCTDHSRSDCPVINIPERSRTFLDKSPFESANMTSKHFRIARGTITEILQRDLGLKKLSRRWVPHQLSSSRKVDHANRSRALLHLLQQLQSFDFEGITTGEES